MARNYSIFATTLMSALALASCNKSPTEKSGEKLEASPSQGSSLSIPDVAASSLAISQALAAGNYDSAAKQAQEAVNATPQNADLLLLLARAQARLQNVGDAVQALQASFDAGFHDPRGALNNPDFDGVRSNPIFAEFARKFQRKQAVGLKQSRARSGPTSSITAGDVSIIEGRDGRSIIRAGDIELKD